MYFTFYVDCFYIMHPVWIAQLKLWTVT